MKLEIGDIFDEFEVLAHIGSGAFSEVYLAHDSVLDRLVILKQLNPDLSENDDEWDAFISEARMTASFYDPGIITVHALRIDSKVGSVVLVMEYMDGGTLADMMVDEFELDLNLIWKLAYQVGNALHYLHTRGILHRDIKPQNVLYSKETGWFKLADFGLAFDPNNPEIEALNDGQPGTLMYMSPEQTRHEPELTERSDLYTFAAVLYEALTGVYYLPINPHEADDETITQCIREQVPLDLPALHQNEKLMARLNNVVHKALAKEPKNRYPTVRRFVRAFTRIVEDMEKENATTATQF